jgi:hypothetical protein
MAFLNSILVFGHLVFTVNSPSSYRVIPMFRNVLFCHSKMEQGGSTSYFEIATFHEKIYPTLKFAEARYSEKQLWPPKC